MNDLNILYTLYTPSKAGVGGGRISIQLLVQEVKKKTNTIMASTEKQPKIKTYTFKKFKKIPYFWYQNFYLSRFLSKIIKKENINIIHSQDMVTTPGAVLAAEKNNIPVIVHFRGYWFSCPRGTLLKPNNEQCSICSYSRLLKCSSKKRLLWDLYKWHSMKSNWELLRKADVKIAVSNAVKENLKRINIEDVEVVPNGRNISFFQNVKGDDIKEEYKLKETVVTYLGRLTYPKGILNMLEIMPSVLKQNEEVSFLIVGSEGLENQIKNFIEKNRLEESVILMGKKPYSEISKIYKISDIILLPSIWQEPFSGIPIEAMASSKPIISSNIGGNVDIVVDGKTGFLLDPLNLDAWKDKINLLIKDKNLREKLGREGLKIAKRTYDISVTTKAIEEIYKRCLK